MKPALLAAALALAMGFGCTSSPLLSNTYPSREALASAVIAAVGRGDVAALRGMSLSETEFREQVWPELPAARPERNLPFSYVWGDLRQKSDEGLARTLARHGGRTYTLVAVKTGGETTRYPTYTVFRETTLQVRDQEGVEDIRLFGSLIEKGGGWKVFSYVVDD